MKIVCNCRSRTFISISLSITTKSYIALKISLIPIDIYNSQIMSSTSKVGHEPHLYRLSRAVWPSNAGLLDDIIAIVDDDIDDDDDDDM